MWNMPCKKSGIFKKLPGKERKREKYSLNDYFYFSLKIVNMNEEQRKYLHLRMVIKDIQFNTYKIRLLTGETKNLKDKMFDIETLANDIDNKIKEAIDREVLFS